MYILKSLQNRRNINFSKTNFPSLEMTILWHLMGLSDRLCCSFLFNASLAALKVLCSFAQLLHFSFQARVVSFLLVLDLPIAERSNTGVFLLRPVSIANLERPSFKMVVRPRVDILQSRGFLKLSCKSQRK